MPGKLWKLRKRFGIAARRVSVRTEVAWYWRWLGLALVLGVVGAVAAWMYDAGGRFAGFDRSEVGRELASTQQELSAARSELAKLRAVANAADSRVSIERTAQQRLAQQIRGLEQDNARLREELAIFESMLSSDARDAQGLAIKRFKVEPDALPGEYRYRILLLASGSKREREFQGRLELVVSLTDEGKSAMITVPEQGDASAAAFRFAFKNFRRVEGTFRVGPNAKVESVQVRVYEAGGNQPRATQSVTLG